VIVLAVKRNSQSSVIKESDRVLQEIVGTEIPRGDWAQVAKRA
jgi:hypothetical protein